MGKRFLKAIYLGDQEYANNWFNMNMLSKSVCKSYNLGRLKDFFLIKRVCLSLWWIKRGFGYIDYLIKNQYFAKHAVKKLQIGCGERLLDGWLNSDLYPKQHEVLHLDATKRFPFSDSVFTYIFTEHMIEHINFSCGVKMLSECYRVLKPNGKIRVATPNLSFLIELYGKKSELQQRYIQWATENHIQQAPVSSDVFVINNFMRDWGHVFIHDESTLRLALEKAGFRNVVRCVIKCSSDSVLSNLENVNRMPNGFLELETLIMEGEKIV